MDATTRATTKRKRAAADIPGSATAGSVPAADIDEVSDAEVEEFYAILRRMRDATRRLCSGTDAAAGAGARPPPRAPAWRPSFSWEDFATAPPPPPPPQQQPDERVAENATPPRAAVLDLNVEPEPDTPTAPATPRSARATA